MLSANNLLRPQDGGPVTVPTQDMVLGSYYLTMDRMGKAEIGAQNIWCEDAGDTNLTAQSIVDADEFLAANAALEKGQKPATYKPIHMYASEDEALMAYNDRVIGPHCPILVRRHAGGQRRELHPGGPRHPRPDHLQQEYPPGPGLCGPQRSRPHLRLRDHLHLRQEAAGPDRGPHHQQARLHRGFRGAGRHQGHRLPQLHHRRHHRFHRGYDHPAQEVRAGRRSPSRWWWTSKTSTRWAL